MLKENNKSGIKMIDFGSSTFLDERMYTYIQSRFYRAPEIMLGIPYDCSIDMWSFGCIIAELYIGYPIFPGESEQDQMSRIIEMVGMPSNDVLAISERKSRFFKYNEGS
jgi:dual specificity tyrosine-phosphorylation-regulated kinase 2/3/4